MLLWTFPLSAACCSLLLALGLSSLCRGSFAGLGSVFTHGGTQGLLDGRGDLHPLQQRCQQFGELFGRQLLSYHKGQVLGMGDGRLKGAGVGFTAAHEADLPQDAFRHQAVQHRKDRAFFPLAVLAGVDDLGLGHGVVCLPENFHNLLFTFCQVHA